MPTRQQVLSISELRKTGNEISFCGGCEGRGIRLPKAVHGFFTKDGATQKKNLVLVNFGCKRAWVGMLVSIPFREVRMPHGEISEGPRYCFTPPTRSTALDFNCIFEEVQPSRLSAKTNFFASFLNLAVPSLQQWTTLGK